MSLQTKRRILYSFLVVMAIWPLCHVGVVRATGLTPWKGCGWAMYCRAPYRGSMRYIPYDADGKRMQEMRRTKRIDKASQQFMMEEALVWREPSRPDYLVHLVAAENEDIVRLLVSIRVYGMDSETGLIFEKYHRFVYHRIDGKMHFLEKVADTGS